MNSYLLDTHIVLWLLKGDFERIGKEMMEKISSPGSRCFVSVVSYWEVVIKESLGKINMKKDFKDYIEEIGLPWIDVTPHHIQHLKVLPPFHNDPFDRLLIAQAKALDLILLTKDRHIPSYF